MTIIFVCDSITKTKDSTKRVLALGAEILDYQELTEEKIKDIINGYLETNKITIEKNALELVLKNSLNNVDIAIKDIEKVANIDNHITTDLINEFGIKLENVDTFEFSNAVIAKKFDIAFSLLDKLLASGVDEFQILGVLSSSYVNMYMVRDAINHGLTDEEVAKKLGYSGTGRVYVMKKNSKIYTTEDLEKIIIDLSDLDIKLKSGYNANYKLKEFLLKL